MWQAKRSRLYYRILNGKPLFAGTAGCCPHCAIIANGAKLGTAGRFLRDAI